LNAERPIRVTFSATASEGKKTDEGTMISPSEPQYNSVVVADPPEAQTATPAATEQTSDILTNSKIWH
jgi:hypothetical protein